MRPFALGLLAVLAGLAPASAQQLDFRSTVGGSEIRLAYRWLDHGGRESIAEFALTRDAVRAAEASFRDFALDAMWREIEAELHDEANRFGQGARLVVTRSGNRLSWRVEARDTAGAEELGRRLRARFDASQSRYLALHLRRRIDATRIMVDFPAAVAAMQAPMRPVARALGDGRFIANTDRARVSQALAFMQAIPYDPLPPGVRQGGDFLPPPALLAQNRGDCDSKSVALAAVLRTYLPSRKLAIVTMPGHAILAVDIAPEPGERTIRMPPGTPGHVAGRGLVALEVAGPALLPPGRIAAVTEGLLGARDVEIWPLN